MTGILCTNGIVIRLSVMADELTAQLMVTGNRCTWIPVSGVHSQAAAYRDNLYYFNTSFKEGYTIALGKQAGRPFQSLNV